MNSLPVLSLCLVVFIHALLLLYSIVVMHMVFAFGVSTAMDLEQRRVVVIGHALVVSESIPPFPDPSVILCMSSLMEVNRGCVNK